MLSKTDILCDCPALSIMAEDPQSPVRFDTRLGEYNIVYTREGGEAKMRLRHCPFCGGKTPLSKRASLFAPLGEDELARLTTLTNPLSVLSDVYATLGEPEDDLPAGTIETTPAQGAQPPVTQAVRTLRYTALSSVADVDVLVYPNDRVGFTFMPKYIGESSVSV
jgi:hypothetical protein